MPWHHARVVLISGIARWADAVIALGARGPLIARVVLVPNEAHAHALVTRGPRALAGTRYFTITAATPIEIDAAHARLLHVIPRITVRIFTTVGFVAIPFGDGGHVPWTPAASATNVLLPDVKQGCAWSWR